MLICSILVLIFILLQERYSWCWLPGATLVKVRQSLCLIRVHVQWVSVQFGNFFSPVHCRKCWQEAASPHVLQRLLALPTNWPLHDNFGCGKQHLVMWLSGDHSYPPVAIALVFYILYYTMQTNLGGSGECAGRTSGLLASWSPITQGKLMPSLMWCYWHF